MGKVDPLNPAGAFLSALREKKKDSKRPDIRILVAQQLEQGPQSATEIAQHIEATVPQIGAAMLQLTVDGYVKPHDNEKFKLTSDGELLTELLK